MQQTTSWQDPIPDLHDLFVACVGYNYGPRPAEKIDEIREVRGSYGWKVIDYLSLNKNDIVLDMGSGCGFLAGVIAKQVKQIHCADINDDFLAFCRYELRNAPNAQVHKVAPANFEKISGLGINKIYSTALWIHFNFYDMILNLKAVNKLLPIGGLLHFDFLDPEGLKDGDARVFHEHLSGYQSDQKQYPLLVKFNSTSAVKVALERCGFQVIRSWQIWEECYGIIAKKIENI